MPPRPPEEDLQFYPRYLFQESPVFTSWARLSAKDVHERLYIRAGYEEGVWFFHGTNHPIRWVRLVGIVVAWVEWERRGILTIDDGSGYLLNAVLHKDGFRPPGTKQMVAAADMEGIEVGMVVKIKGCIGEYRETKQMNLRKWQVVRDTAEEVDCWREMVVWRNEVLMKPWVVDEKTQKRVERRMNRQFFEEGRKLKGAQRDLKEKRRKYRRLEAADDGFRGKRRPDGYQPSQTRPKDVEPAKTTAQELSVDQERSGVIPQLGFKGKRRSKKYRPPPRINPKDGYEDIDFGDMASATEPEDRNGHEISQDVSEAGSTNQPRPSGYQLSSHQDYTEYEISEGVSEPGFRGKRRSKKYQRTPNSRRSPRSRIPDETIMQLYNTRDNDKPSESESITIATMGSQTDHEQSASVSESSFRGKRRSKPYRQTPNSRRSPRSRVPDETIMQLYSTRDSEKPSEPGSVTIATMGGQTDHEQSASVSESSFRGKRRSKPYRRMPNSRRSPRSRIPDEIITKPYTKSNGKHIAIHLANHATQCDPRITTDRDQSESFSDSGFRGKRRSKNRRGSPVSSGTSHITNTICEGSLERLSTVNLGNWTKGEQYQNTPESDYREKRRLEDQCPPPFKLPLKPYRAAEISEEEFQGKYLTFEESYESEASLDYNQASNSDYGLKGYRRLQSYRRLPSPFHILPTDHNDCTLGEKFGTERETRERRPTDNQILNEDGNSIRSQGQSQTEGFRGKRRSKNHRPLPLFSPVVDDTDQVVQVPATIVKPRRQNDTVVQVPATVVKGKGQRTSIEQRAKKQGHKFSSYNDRISYRDTNSVVSYSSYDDLEFGPQAEQIAVDTYDEELISKSGRRNQASHSKTKTHVEEWLISQDGCDDTAVLPQVSTTWTPGTKLAYTDWENWAKGGGRKRPCPDVDYLDASATDKTNYSADWKPTSAQPQPRSSNDYSQGTNVVSAGQLHTRRKRTRLVDNPIPQSARAGNSMHAKRNASFLSQDSIAQNITKPISPIRRSQEGSILGDVTDKRLNSPSNSFRGYRRNTSEQLIAEENKSKKSWVEKAVVPASTSNFKFQPSSVRQATVTDSKGRTSTADTLNFSRFPTPQSNAHKEQQQQSDFRGHRRANKSIPLPEPQAHAPQPQATTRAPRSRTLKKTVLSYIRKKDPPVLSIPLLEAVPDIYFHAYTLAEDRSSLLHQTLLALAADGYLLKGRQNQEEYIVVGPTNLGGIIGAAIKSAQKKAPGPQAVVSVRQVWMKVKAMGGVWKHVGKAAIEELLERELAKALGGGAWKGVKGGWAWEMET